MKAEYEIQEATCEVCGKDDEGVLISKKGNWRTLWAPLLVFVCEGCISRIFRKFDPDK